MEVNGLILIQQDTLLHESVSEIVGKVVEIQRSIRETLSQSSSQTLHVFYHVIVVKDM
jgi:hypothetical protein